MQQDMTRILPSLVPRSIFIDNNTRDIFKIIVMCRLQALQGIVMVVKHFTGSSRMFTAIGRVFPEDIQE